MSLLSYHTSGVCLTVREREVLRLVADGFSAKEVALRIAIAPRTVERHIDNARLKMRARNRAHLITCAIVSGLLSNDESDLIETEPLLPFGVSTPRVRSS